ncbi:MAG: hypothetical protein ACKOEO_25690 [Planctomycetaceae bacterium]
MTEPPDNTPNPAARPPARRRRPTIPAPAALHPEFTFDSPDNSAEDDGSSHVVDALATSTALSFYSSLTFHLFLWLSALILLPLLGFDFSELLTEEQSPLQAALADENILDDAAQFEVITEVPDSSVTASASPEQLAARLQISDAAWLRSSVDDIWSSTNAARGSEADANSGSGILLKVPEGGLAVTKGSFTAFTIPARPAEKQAYLIVIEIKLPDGVKSYRASDLSGKVKGSDGYEQKLPVDSRFPSAARYPSKGKILQLESSTSLDVESNRAQIIIRIPGGARQVRDQISIRSKRLRESQELELIFE